ncbi:hypothetical protein ASD11_00380 [Aeromicrobium sp. Root495]|nr:hypothetical protein ASD11_00380 [Aeromicrobium sp. Root495]
MDGVTSRVDGQTEQAAQRATQVIVLAARVLRWPTLALLVLPLPLIITVLALAPTFDGPGRFVVLAVGIAMALVSAAFAGRRYKVLKAVEDPVGLATELGIAVNLSGRADETRGVLEAVAGGGGWRAFSRLKGLWSGVGMTGRWIDGIGDLPRARYFLPPKIGTTVTVVVAALWLLPVSFVAAVFTIIAAVARA